MIEDFKKLISKPTNFYKDLKKKSYGDVIKFLLKINFIPYFLYFLFLQGGELNIYIGLTIIISLIYALLSLTIGPFINALITHIGVLIVGGKDYKKTFLATGHAMSISAPYLLTAAILVGLFINASEAILISLTLLGGLIAFAGGIHVLITEIIGLKVLHKLTTLRAIIAALIIPITIFLLFVLLIVALSTILIIGFL